MKKVAEFFTTAYLLIIFCIYPFYLRDGYIDIGEAKAGFFLYVSIAAFFLFCVLGILLFLNRVKERISSKEDALIPLNRISATDLFILVYATVIFLSFVNSPYREEALHGADGWYMGSALLLLLCGIYFCLAGMWEKNEIVLILASAASAVVFLLGICNRFSFYPIAFEVTLPEFISTLGNINWFCGYLSVVAPVGIGLGIFKGKTGKKRAVWIFYSLLTFTAGFCQGSSSIFLWFGTLFFVLLWICAEKKEWMENWLALMAIWGISAQAVHLLRCLFPEKYNYDLDNLCGICTGSFLTMGVSLAAVILYLFLKRREEVTPAFTGKLRKILAALLILILAAAFTYTALNFNESWGNGRGAAWIAGFRMLKQMPLKYRLLGVGPDCFSAYAYSFPEIESDLTAVFGNSRLTNAHNEILTNLVNIGAAGVCAYVGIFVSFLLNCKKQGKKEPLYYVFLLSAVCYFTHNTVSFANVLNLPFLFLILGMGHGKG